MSKSDFTTETVETNDGSHSLEKKQLNWALIVISKFQNYRNVRHISVLLLE